MNAHELEKSIDKMEIVIKLLSAHIPSMFTKDTLNHAIDANKEMKKYLSDITIS